MKRKEKGGRIEGKLGLGGGWEDRRDKEQMEDGKEIGVGIGWADRREWGRMGG